MSKEPSLKIGITLEHEDGIVRAQRWLKGYVTIQVQEEDIHLDDKNNTLYIELIGKEITRDPTSSEECVSDIFHENSTRCVMNSVLEAKCEYRFPFSMYAPGSVAPSMELFADFEGEKVLVCCIEYILTASFHSFTVKKKIEILGQPLTSKLHPVTVEPSVVPVMTKSFPYKKMTATSHRHRVQSYDEKNRHHGCLLWAAHVENTHVGKGRDAAFSFSLRNCCSCDVVKLSAKLVEKVLWKTETSTKSHAIELSYALMPNFAFMKHQKATLSRYQSQIVPKDHEVEQEMRRELSLVENTVLVNIPTECRDSYKGKLIQVTHQLLIEARAGDTHGQDQSAVMTMELPLKVFDSPILDGHHHHLHEFDMLNPAQVAEEVMTKWPDDSEQQELHASFTSVDDTSWTASDDDNPLVLEQT